MTVTQIVGDLHQYNPGQKAEADPYSAFEQGQGQKSQQEGDDQIKNHGRILSGRLSLA